MTVNVVGSQIKGYNHLIRTTVNLAAGGGGQYNVNLANNTFINANAVKITGCVRVGTTNTVTTASAHGLSTGNTAIVSGMDQAEYNISGAVTVKSPTTFEMIVSGSPTTPGTITWEATARKSTSTYAVGSVESKGIESATAIGNKFVDFDQGGSFSNAPREKTETGNTLIRATTSTIW
jgi:hypothetical protein